MSCRFYKGQALTLRMRLNWSSWWRSWRRTPTRKSVSWCGLLILTGKRFDESSSIWRISPDQLTSFLNIEQGEQWKVYQPWGQFRCRVPSMAGKFFLRKSISVVFPAIFLIYWVDQVFTFLKRNSAFNNFHNEYLSIKSYSYITCDKWPNQDGQPNGEELESGVAIHTLRMPNAYRCLFYPVRLYPEAKFFFVQGCGRGWKTVRCL